MSGLARAARWAPVFLSVGALAALVVAFEGWGSFVGLDAGLVALGVAVALLQVTTVGAFKWWRTTRAFGLDLGFGEVWRLWTGLLPVTFFAPLQSGHLLYAVALHRARPIGAFAALESVAYDKGTTLVATVAWIGVGQALLPADHALSHPLLAVGPAVCVVLFFADRWVWRALGRWAWFRERSRLVARPLPWRVKAELLALGMVYQASDSVSLWLGAWALGAALDPAVAFGAFPVVLLLTYVPVTVSGFGLREPLTVALVGGGLTADEAVAAALLVDAYEYVLPAVFGVVALPGLVRVLWRRRAEGESLEAVAGAGPGPDGGAGSG